MRTQVEQHPGGVAGVVPAALAARAGLRGGEVAELDVVGGRLVVIPAGPATLAELLAGITPENLHGEWADGPGCPARGIWEIDGRQAVDLRRPILGTC